MTITAPSRIAARTTTNSRSLVGLAVLALLAATVFGASQLAFLCDDAYIHFRYVANAHAGHGLVWNAPPFRPVEGSGFLWTMLLWGIWSQFGIEPPQAANAVSIGLGVLQVLVLAGAALRLCSADGRRLPATVGLCALVAIVGNRTFLQWMTGGLDTALFNLPFLSWVLLAFRPAQRRTTTWLAMWSASAALAVLTRPDGLPAIAATIAVAMLLVARRDLRIARAIAGLSPLATVVAHLAWRRWFYGEWLPNTYYAKVVDAWPEAGLRYFACFALENGAWLWFPLAAVWLVAECVRHGCDVFGQILRAAPAAAAVGVVLFHAGYYLFRVGGDHFEYRVLSQLVPLGVLACVAMAARLTNGRLLPIAVAASLGLAGTFGWFHLAQTRNPLNFGLSALTPHVPTMLQPITRWFDHQQAWLFSRFIGLRCFFHACVLHQTAHVSYPLPLRVENAPDAIPIATGGAVGYMGWQLRDCAILDLLGLNDWVIARSPNRDRGAPAARERFRHTIPAADADRNGRLDAAELTTGLLAGVGDYEQGGHTIFLVNFLLPLYDRDELGTASIDTVLEFAEELTPDRLMAHERWPPPDYIEAFEPNVRIVNGKVEVTPRQAPMTPERVRGIEAEWRQRLRAH